MTKYRVSRSGGPMLLILILLVSSGAGSKLRVILTVLGLTVPHHLRERLTTVTHILSGIVGQAVGRNQLSVKPLAVI